MVDLSTDSSGKPPVAQTARGFQQGKMRRFGSGDFQKIGSAKSVFQTLFLLAAIAGCAFLVYWAVTIFLSEKVR